MIFRKSLFIRIQLFTILCLSSTFSAPKSILHIYGLGSAWIWHSQSEQTVKTMLDHFQTNYKVAVTSSNSQEIVNSLSQYDIVILNNVSGGAFTTADAKLKFQTWMENGGRAIGYHETNDHGNYWSWWTDLHGGCDFGGKANNVTYKVDADSEMSKNLPYKKMWTEMGLEAKAAITNATEIMFFKPSGANSNGDPRGQPGITILQVESPNSYTLEIQERLTYRPITWEKKIGKGKYIYTALGHGPADYEGGYLEAATWGWMKYLMGDYDSAATTISGQMATKINGLVFVGNRLEVNYGNPYKLNIIDITGKEFISASGQGLHNYSLAELKPGIYFAKVSGQFGSNSLRILLK